MPDADHGTGQRVIDRAALVESGRKLALWLAGRFARTVDEREEMRSEACAALLVAAQRFDPSRGTWPAYLTACVEDRLRKHRLRERREAERFPRADPRVNADGELVDAVDTLAVEPSPEQDPATAYTSNRVRAALDELPMRERTIIEMHYWQSETLDAAGRMFGISRERARQIQVAAFDKLREKLR